MSRGRGGRRRAAVCAGALVAAASLLASGCGGTDPARGPGPGARAQRVVLFTVDTLRADRLSCYGGPVATPVLDAFAAESVVFEAAYSQATHTHAALSSALTGLYPPRNGVLSQSGQLARGVYPVPLLLQARGIATGSFVANMCRLQTHERTVFRDGWDEVFCGEDEETDHYVWDEAVVGAALEWLGRQEGPALAWVHLMDPHADRVPSPAVWDYGREPVPTVEEQLEVFWTWEQESRFPPPEVLEQIEALYAAEIAGVDRQFGRLLAALEERGAEDVAVVFTSDHGEELYETWTKYAHGLSPTEGVLRVPLLLRVPGERPARRDELVELLQLGPTLLELFDVPAPYELDGASLLAPERRRNYAVSFCGRLATIRHGDRRLWTRSPRLSDPPDYAHFLKKRQLLANRWSQSELCVASYSAEEPSRPRWMDLEDSETRMRAEQLRRTLLGLIEEFGELPAPEDLDDPEFLEDLRRLGYL